MSPSEPFAVFVGRRFIGVRTGRFYWKLRDIQLHRLLFSERHGHGYRRLLRVGRFELGVRVSATLAALPETAPGAGVVGGNPQ